MKMLIDFRVEDVKASMDFIATGVAFGTLAGLLPAFASLLTIIWMGIRIYESPTVQSFVSKFRRKREEKKDGTE